MSAVTRTIVLAVVLTAFVAALAGWAGVQYGLRETTSSQQLDDVLHHKLDLTADQSKKIDVLEADFGRKHRELEKEMGAANADLATALEHDHAYGPGARAAVTRFHRAMAMLQEQTIEHVLAMRRVLTPEQAKKFDATVHAALVENKP